MSNITSKTYPSDDESLAIVERAIKELKDIRLLYLDGWSYRVTADQMSRVVDSLKELLPEEPCCCDKCLEEVHEEINQALDEQHE